MKRPMMLAVAALFLAGAAYPLFALDSHQKSETPTVEQRDDSVVPEMLAKDEKPTAPTPGETAEATTEEETQPSTVETIADDTKEMVKDAASDVVPAPEVPAADAVNTVTNPTSILPKK
ncbi:MAG: hypothetical protein AB7G75_21950 [Candidatus Binatia bacterium]